MYTKSYRSVLSAAQSKLTAEIDRIRSSIPHSGETGALIEQQFRSQLAEVLPERIGVSHGFVVDSTGGVSKQMDIILYDRPSTPRILVSDGVQMFPVEMTYACGEVKATLNTSELEDSFCKCSSYKRLRREAYSADPEDTIYTTLYTMFGRPVKHWQSIFFCIAVEGINYEYLLKKYVSIVLEKKLDICKRIDTIVSLSSPNGDNMLTNVTGGEVRGGVVVNESVKSFDFIPNFGSKLRICVLKEPWSCFVTMLLSYMTKAYVRRVNMLTYGGKDSF